MPDFDLFQMSQPSAAEVGEQSVAPDPESEALGRFNERWSPPSDPGNAQRSRGLPEYTQEGPAEVASQQPPVQEGQPQEGPPQHLQVDPNEVRQLRNQLQQFELYRPLLERVNQDPSVIDRVFNVQPNQEFQTPELPARPERPIDYSRAAAIQDPGSSSARYEQQLMEYNEALANYNHQVVQMQQQRIQAQQANELRMRREEMMRQQQQEAIRNDLRQQAGLNDQEVQDFENWATQQNFGDVQGMVRLWRLDRQLSQNRPDTVRTQMERMQRTVNQGPPPVQGSTPPMVGPEDQLVQSLRRYSDPYNGQRRYGGRNAR